MRLRNALLIVLPTIAVVAASIVGGLVLQLRLPEVEAEQQARAAESVQVVANSVDSVLHAYEALLHQSDYRIRHGQNVAVELAALVAAEPGIAAAYLVEADGRIVAAALPGKAAPPARFNFAAQPELQQALNHSDIRWSDRLLSIVSGEVVIAAGIGSNQRLLVIELQPSSLNDKVGQFTRAIALPLIVVDGLGGWIAGNSDIFGSAHDNFMADPALRAAIRGETPDLLQRQGKDFHIVSSKSAHLSWTFVSAVPSGLSNPHYRRTVRVVVWGVLASTILALLLSPLLAQLASSAIVRLSAISGQVARGIHSEHWPHSHIDEINDLTANLRAMMAILEEREASLRDANEHLEARIAARTVDLATSNRHLEKTLQDLQNAQSFLIQQEKLAALGALVAGVAHELNTPIGNALMSATTLQDHVRVFRTKEQSGLRRSDLSALVNDAGEMADISVRNLRRAAELVASFKQVAADQTSSQRRKFTVGELVNEVLITLRPSLKRLPIAIDADISEGLEIDSYPGALVQILTNLINNAVAHAFEGRPRGRISIAARAAEPDQVEITVSDDGIGIAPEVMPRIFDPFYTTRLGRGGTGLGLTIVHNLASNVLEGEIAVETEIGRGSLFRLRIPRRVTHEAPDCVA